MRVIFALIIGLAVGLLPAVGGASADDGDLLSLSIQDLMEIEVTSVSKRAQKLSEAPAAVTVLTSEDIRRSGMTTVPDLLRMVPGLHVANIDASTWAITARGFNGQFANKLLVMIDGRTVYTPLFSGVYWDVQDLVLEDIERIEVVRGPGGTMWGVNAVNGVINIITKEAADTQGLLVSSLVGNIERTSSASRYGGQLADDAHYRTYLKYFNRADFDNRGGVNSHDAWSVARGGVRFDWKPTGADSLTLQGDYYNGDSDQTTLVLGPASTDFSGGNVIGRWVRSYSDTSSLQLQFYYDRTERSNVLLREDRDTFDVELQNRLNPLPGHDLVWGASYRLTSDDIRSSSVAGFDPSDRTEHLASLFFQDEFPLFHERLRLTLGSKVEYNGYSGFEFLPNARLLWSPNERHSAWAAVSRAVRAPSRAENDVSLLAPAPTLPVDFVLMTGNSAFDSEHVLVYEIGYRAHPLDPLSIDVAAYYNDYDDLRSLETSGLLVDYPSAGLFTATADGGNVLGAQGYGVELSSTWSVTEFWRLVGAYTFMKIDIDTNGSLDPTAVGQENDTPTHQFNVRSLLDLPWNFQVDTAVFWVDDVSNQGVGDYARFDARLSWTPTPGLELSVIGQNLSDGSHNEFGHSFTGVATSVPRSVFGRVTWKY
jgi:iron complex outermembrane receptor protein